MITADQRAAYDRDGFIVVPDLLSKDELNEVRDVIAALVAGAASVETHTDVYDLEPGHSRTAPQVRRIKQPHKVHAAFDRIVRKREVLDVVAALIGPNLRLQGSKLNMKAARYGSPVEWHQDWAFYPHTNDDLLAIGVMLDDMNLDNGPLLVVPGSHKGPVWNHHGGDGRFCGLVDPADIDKEIASAVALTGRAGSMSFHHVRALHGSAARLIEDRVGSSSELAWLLGHHWREAGEEGRAVNCLLVAADQAARGWAKGHAVTLYSTAFGLLPEDDPMRPEVRRRQLVAHAAYQHLVMKDVEAAERPSADAG